MNKRNRITRDLTKHVEQTDKSLRYKGYDRLLDEAESKFTLIAELNAISDAGGTAAVGARKRLREMRDVKYATDPKPNAGELHIEAKQLAKKGGKVYMPARGSTGKAAKIAKGYAARQSQGKGI